MPLPGDPETVLTLSTRLVQDASLIQQATEDLLALILDGDALALDAVRDHGARATELLTVAHTRTDGTGQALRTYAAQLKNAHRDADQADEEARYAMRLLNHYADQEHTLRAHIEGLSDDPVFLARIRQLEAQLTEVGMHQRAQSERHLAARERHERAERAMHEAAERARTLVRSVLADSDEHLLDRVSNAVHSVQSLVANLRDWAEGYLSGVWALLKRVISTISAVLAAAVVIVLLLKLSIVLPFIIGMAVAVAVSFLAAFLITSIVSDVAKPTPPVRRKFVNDVIRDAHAEPSGLGDVLLEAVEVDSNTVRDATGAPVETIVKITRIVDTDGIVRWRVALPSTQEWFTWIHGNDGGAVNDLDSNLALMLTPALKTQYERAVVEAMKQAGVRADDPVMLVGFSQGGIIAGHLAAYSTEFTWDVVVAAGAPIDNMPIPERTRVVSVQHVGDPVHHLDSGLGGPGIPPKRSNWVTITGHVPDADGVATIHNADAYQKTMQAIPNIDAGFEHYFGSGVQTYGSASEYYHWRE